MEPLLSLLAPALTLALLTPLAQCAGRPTPQTRAEAGGSKKSKKGGKSLENTKQTAKTGEKPALPKPEAPKSNGAKETRQPATEPKIGFDEAGDFVPPGKSARDAQIASTMTAPSSLAAPTRSGTTVTVPTKGDAPPTPRRRHHKKKEGGELWRKYWKHVTTADGKAGYTTNEWVPKKEFKHSIDGLYKLNWNWAPKEKRGIVFAYFLKNPERLGLLKKLRKVYGKKEGEHLMLKLVDNPEAPLFCGNADIDAKKWIVYEIAQWRMQPMLDNLRQMELNETSGKGEHFLDEIRNSRDKIIHRYTWISHFCKTPFEADHEYTEANKLQLVQTWEADYTRYFAKQARMKEIVERKMAWYAQERGSREQTVRSMKQNEWEVIDWGEDENLVDATPMEPAQTAKSQTTTTTVTMSVADPLKKTEKTEASKFKPKARKIRSDEQDSDRTKQKEVDESRKGSESGKKSSVMNMLDKSTSGKKRRRANRSEETEEENRKVPTKSPATQEESERESEQEKKSGQEKKGKKTEEEEPDSEQEKKRRSSDSDKDKRKKTKKGKSDESDRSGKK